MSLYFVPNQINESRLQSVAREIARDGSSVVIEPGDAGHLWIGDTVERFGPALDKRTGVRAVSSGRLVWSAQDWARSARLSYSGGLANRLVIERYLKSGPSSVAPYNGAAVIVIHDPRDGRTHLWTDQFGYHPCYLYRDDNPQECIITTFPDALLADPDGRVSYDLISMAEFVRAWRVTPPNTYFAEIKYAGAASHITIDPKAGLVERRSYWTPFQDEFFPSLSAATDALAEAVRSAIAERTAIAERPVFFVSGGADSRVMLFCTPDRSRVVGINLYEREASETQVARKLCEAAGCGFVAIQRDNDFYPRLLPEIVHWSGAMWSAEDSHYLGFADRVAEYNPDLVMTACTTDWVFKGYGLEKGYRSVFGRYMPFLVYTNERVDGFLPNVPLTAPPRFAEALQERMSTWFEGCPRKLSTPRDRLMVEDRRIRPACYTVSVSGQIMYRIYPYDTFLADSRIAACYSRTHPDWKLNRELWGKVAARVCTEAGRIVDANYGWRVDASALEKLAVFAKGWVSRRLDPPPKQVADDDRPPSSGSWPDYGWYALYSPTLKELWESVTNEERNRMDAICGLDPWSKPLAEWSQDGQYLFRVLTLLCHWRESCRRRQRASLTPELPISHNYH
jgi:asparagine synthase (glutamine-hydrolysing)